MDKYAVIGSPISHSKSPLIHHMFAKQCSQSLVYERVEGSLDKFEDEIRQFFSVPDNKGLNVTVPFKERAFAMCDVLSQRAEMAEAVNTLWARDGLLYGDNTDGCGLVTDLQNNHMVSLRAKRVLILGAGGAVKGVILPILEQQPKSITIANRTFAKAQAIVGRYNNRADLKAAEFGDLSGPFDLVINGTSASLSGEIPKLPEGIMSSNTDVYDMMYGDGQTVFNQWAQNLGVRHTMDGLGMLVEQAAEAFRIWRGVKPDTAECIAIMRV
jgi:shikimate dehydrogenase